MVMMQPTNKGTRMSANALAAQFAATVNEHGWRWLSVKQTKFLSDLVSREMARAGGRERSEVVAYRSHGWPILSGTLPGGREWECQIYHNGAGRFRVTG